MPRSGNFHPLRNIVHIVLGLGILVLAAYQVGVPCRFKFQRTHSQITSRITYHGRLGPDCQVIPFLMRKAKVQSRRCGLYGQWLVSIRVYVFAKLIVASQLFPSAYCAGFYLIRKQLAQERLGWNLSTPGPLSQPVASSRDDFDLNAARWRILDHRIDDGTHDIYSSVRDVDDAATETPDITAVEMRELQRVVPISVLV